MRLPGREELGWRRDATASSDGPHVPATSLLARATRRIGRVLCGLRGHDELRHYEGTRVVMRCTNCGHDTPGWDTSGRAPLQRFDGDARRHALKPLRLTNRKSA